MVEVNTSHLGFATILVCGLGCTAPLVAISDHTITQLAAPAAFRGRVLATSEAVTSFMLLAWAGLAGVFSDVVGVRVVFNGAAALTPLSALMALRLLRFELPRQRYEGVAT